jgi:hypothetical protein
VTKLLSYVNPIMSVQKKKKKKRLSCYVIESTIRFDVNIILFDPIYHNLTSKNKIKILENCGVTDKFDMSY